MIVPKIPREEFLDTTLERLVTQLLKAEITYRAPVCRWCEGKLTVHSIDCPWLKVMAVVNWLRASPEGQAAAEDYISGLDWWNGFEDEERKVTS